MLEWEKGAINAAADLVVLGKHAFEGAMGRPIYLPGSDRITEIWESVNFTDVPAIRRQEIAARFKDLILVSSNRSNLQMISRRHPRELKENYQAKIRQATDGEVDMDPVCFSIEWGLLCMALVVGREEYRKLAEYLSGDGESLAKTTGFLSPIVNELGQVAVVLRGSDSRTTIRHEDMHVLAMILGTAGDDEAMEHAIEEIASSRGDPRQVLSEINIIRRGIKKRIGREFQARIWEGSIPGVEVVRNKVNQQVWKAGMEGLADNVYSSGAEFTEEEQLRMIFTAMKWGGDLFNYYEQLSAVVKKAAADYKGPFRKWDWAASRLIVMPVGLPVKAFANALGVNLRDVNVKYPGNPTMYLAEALATHIQMTAESDDYLAEAEKLLGKREVYGRICDEFQITEADLKRELIKQIT